MARLPAAARRWLTIGGVTVAVVVVVLGVSLFSLYEATQRVPEFYHRALSQPPDQVQQDRDAFVAQAAALASDLDHSGQWQSLFTANQINAWLALELANHYPDLLLGDLREPRLVIRDHEATLACRYESGEMAAVLSLAFDVYLHRPNVLAVRIRRARAGNVPVPLAQVLESVAHAAAELNLRIEWRKLQGDPVALVHFDESSGSPGRFRLDVVELRDGEVFLAGTAGNPPAEESPPSSAPPSTSPAPTASLAAPDDAHPVVGAAPSDTIQK